GFLLITVGTIGFINLTPSTTGASLQWWLITRGLGLGLTNIPLQTLALSVVSNRAMARATSLLNVTRQVASAIGISVLTTFLTTRATSHAPHVVATFKSTQLAQVVAQAQTACVAKLGQVPGVQACVQGIVQGKTQAYVFNHSFTQGLNDTFVFSMIATGICIALALLVGKDPAVEAAKRAQARGEDVQRQPVMVGE
ncbi:MAG TPA: MFS transporter, partial [Ktedonobacterales bacterium]|nr:MFS transporter [Ktedonobacterales bacterium]